MKTSLTIIFLLLFKANYSQHCNCAQTPELKESISCKPTLFKNQAKIFWQYDCDSSWLVFKSPKGRKTVLYSLDAGLMELTERLGYSYAAEYRSLFLIKNNLISGCCTPSEYILFNKVTGKKESELGSLIFYSEDPKHPIVVYFENTQYKPPGDNKNLFNNLVLKNINSNRTYKIGLPKGRIWSTLQFAQEIYPEYLIEDTEIISNKLKITYRFKLEEKGEWQSEVIVINLDNYGS